MRKDRDKTNYIVLAIIYCQAYASNATLQESASQFCPYTMFCHLNASEVLHISGPCCSQCSCEEECLSSATCCPDFFKNINGNSDESFIEQHATGNCRSIVMTSSRSSPSENQAAAQHYRVIDTCLNDESNYENGFCENQNQTDLSDIVWVSDVIRGTVFRNRHCALCSNITDFVSWTLHADCVEALTKGIDKLFEVLSLEACSVFVRPPKMLEKKLGMNKMSCFEISGYSVCNETGNWREYDPLLQKACEASEWRFATPGFRKNIHKNVFCYACNVKNLNEIPFKCVGNQGTPDETSFSVLLAFDEMSKTNEDAPIQTSTHCGMAQTEDKYLKTCRPVLCPPGSMPYFGTCKNVFQQINNLNLEVAFSIKPIQVTPGLEPPPSLIYDEFHDITGFRDANCQPCEYSLWIENHEEELTAFLFWAKININAGWPCSLEFIRARSAEVVTRELVLRHDGNESSTYSVALDRRPGATLFKNMTKSISETKIRNCMPSILRLMDVRTCPQVELSYDELSALQSHLTEDMSSAFAKHQTTDRNSTARVCLEDYNSMVMRRNGNSFCLVHRLFYVLFLIIWGPRAILT